MTDILATSRHRRDRHYKETIIDRRTHNKGTITDRDRQECPERGGGWVDPLQSSKILFFWSSILKISSKTYENL